MFLHTEKNYVGNLFKLKENHTSVKTEVIAGITTFMTMAYILAVNPKCAFLQLAWTLLLYY